MGPPAEKGEADIGPRKVAIEVENVGGRLAESVRAQSIVMVDRSDPGNAVFDTSEPATSIAPQENVTLYHGMGIVDAESMFIGMVQVSYADPLGNARLCKQWWFRGRPRSETEAPGVRNKNRIVMMTAKERAEFPKQLLSNFEKCDGG
jgi:hypothetical protein